MTPLKTEKREFAGRTLQSVIFVFLKSSPSSTSTERTAAGIVLRPLLCHNKFIPLFNKRPASFWRTQQHRRMLKLFKEKLGDSYQTLLFLKFFFFCQWVPGTSRGPCENILRQVVFYNKTQPLFRNQLIANLRFVTHLLRVGKGYLPLHFVEDFSSPFFISTSISAPHFKHLTLPLKFQYLWSSR